jgi:hypothetical protein
VVRLGSGPGSFTISSGLTESQRLVVRDAAAWREVWTAISARQLPPPAVPDVDFTREMLVVAALGQRSSGGYHILVDSAAAQPSALTVTIRTISPGPTCGVTLAVTEPVDIARLPRRDGVVVSRERPEVRMRS